MSGGVSTTTEESLTRTDDPLLRRKAFYDNFPSQMVSCTIPKTLSLLVLQLIEKHK